MGRFTNKSTASEYTQNDEDDARQYACHSIGGHNGRKEVGTIVSETVSDSGGDTP